MAFDQVRDDPSRVLALADILCAAAVADEHLAKEELAIVRGTLLQVLGASELPPEVAAHVANFDPAAFDVYDALDRLGLESQEDREALLAATFDIVRADRFVDSSEYGFVGELAGLLKLPLPAPLR